MIDKELGPSLQELKGFLEMSLKAGGEVQKEDAVETEASNSVVTGKVNDFTELVKINDGNGINVFKAKIRSKDIPAKDPAKDISRTRLFVEVSLLKSGEEMGGKEIVLKRFIGERENPPGEIFKDAMLQMHKDKLSQRQRWGKIKEMKVFADTRDMLFKGRNNMGNSLERIKESLPGSRGMSPLHRV